MKSTDEQERRAAKAILADGKWSHNHYSPQQMEDLIARVINAIRHLQAQLRRREREEIERLTMEHKQDE